MSAQHATTPLWLAVMHSPLPESAGRIHIGLGEYRHVWPEKDMRHFAHQVAEPIQERLDKLLEALKQIESLGNKMGFDAVIYARAAIANVQGEAA